MPPKRKRRTVASTSKAAKKTKLADPTPTEPEIITGPVLYVEHSRSCHVFKRRANDLHSQIVEQLPSIQLVLNPSDPPRRGAFDISFAQTPTDDTNARTEIWSGLKKGPPRALKFPAPDVIIDAIKKILKH